MCDYYTMYQVCRHSNEHIDHDNKTICLNKFKHGQNCKLLYRVMQIGRYENETYLSGKD